MLKAVILDDEIRGSTLLSRKLEMLSDELRVVAIFNDPIKALAKIIDIDPDVLFLDVEMPGLDGFQFLEKLGSFSFQVIFTTAYDSYTLAALRLSAVDYLLKPVDEEELQMAIFRLKKRINELKIKAINQPTNNRLALSTAEGIYLLEKSTIIRIEAQSNYSTFFLSDQKQIMVSKTLKEFEQLLQEKVFLRINRSVIINLSYVAKYRKGDGGTLELIDGTEIEVAASRKEKLMELLFT
jgi:two-component system LytT family response regulator